MKIELAWVNLYNSEEIVGRNHVGIFFFMGGFVIEWKNYLSRKKIFRALKMDKTPSQIPVRSIAHLRVYIPVGSSLANGVDPSRNTLLGSTPLARSSFTGLINQLEIFFRLISLFFVHCQLRYWMLFNKIFVLSFPVICLIQLCHRSKYPWMSLWLSSRMALNRVQKACKDKPLLGYRYMWFYNLRTKCTNTLIYFNLIHKSWRTIGKNSQFFTKTLWVNLKESLHRT